MVFSDVFFCFQHIDYQKPSNRYAIGHPFQLPELKGVEPERQLRRSGY